MNDKEKAIGVFDSGLGGISVLKELVQQMPNERYLYFGDSAFAPYGVKERADITKRCIHICDTFVSMGVKAIVIACNTATSACVTELRKRYKEIPIVGMEPALKPAVNGKNKQHVLVMATNFTLKEKKFANLLAQYQEDHVIYKLPCPKLVEIVENSQLEDTAYVKEVLHEYLDSQPLDQIDSIVLGCTHFVFYKKLIREVVGDRISIIDGNAGTSKHVQDLLAQRNALQDEKKDFDVTFLNSGDEQKYLPLSKKLFDY